MFLGFIIIKLLSLLGTEEYGIYALVLTLSNLFGLAYLSPINQTFNRYFYEYKDKHEYRSFQSNILWLIFWGIIFVLLVISAAIIFKNFLGYSVLMIILCGIFVILFKLDEFSISLLNIIRKRKTNSILINSERGSVIIIFLAMHHYMSMDLLHVLIVFNCVFFIFIVTRVFVFNNYTGKTNDVLPYTSKTKKELQKKIFVYLSPFIIWGIAGWLQLNGEKWIIANILSTADVGIYAVMLSLVNVLITIPSNYLADFLMPVIFNRFGDFSNQQNIARGTSYINFNIAIISILTIGVSVFTFFFGHFLLKIISNESFVVYSHLLPLLSLGSGLISIGQAMTFYGLAYNKPGIYITPKIVTGVLSVLLNIVFVTVYKIDGIAYSSLLIGIIYILTTFYSNKKLLSNIKESTSL